MDINATIIGQTIAFMFFVWFCVKYVWPPLIGAIEERQVKISEGLAAADNAEKDLELAQKRAAEVIKEAKAQAAEIVDKANKRHAQIVDAAKHHAQAEADKIKVIAQAELEQERAKAQSELSNQLASLVMIGTEKVLERTIDEKAHADIIDKLVAEI